MWRSVVLVLIDVLGEHIASLADFSTLKTDAICSPETSINTRTTRRHTPENGILHSHRRENLKSYTPSYNFKFYQLEILYLRNPPACGYFNRPIQLSDLKGGKKRQSLFCGPVI
jgi:hypothetical protein